MRADKWQASSWLIIVTACQFVIWLICVITDRAFIVCTNSAFNMWHFSSVCHPEGQFWRVCQPDAGGWSSACLGWSSPLPLIKTTHIFLQTGCGCTEIGEIFKYLQIIFSYNYAICSTEAITARGLICIVQIVSVCVFLKIWLCQNLVKLNSQFVKLLVGPQRQTCMFQIKRILGFCCRYSSKIKLNRCLFLATGCLNTW